MKLSSLYRSSNRYTPRHLGPWFRYYFQLSGKNRQSPLESASLKYQKDIDTILADISKKQARRFQLIKEHLDTSQELLDSEIQAERILGAKLRQEMEQNNYLQYIQKDIDQEFNRADQLVEEYKQASQILHFQFYITALMIFSITVLFGLGISLI